MWAADLPLPFVILASGQGSNAKVLIDHASRNPQRLKPLALISDRSDAPALGVAQTLGVETRVVGVKEEAHLLELLAQLRPRWACLAGYRRLVSQAFLDFFFDAELGFSRVLNVHPSLLPAYPGLGGYAKAFRDGVKVSGVTVHLVDAGLDTGLPVLQEAFARTELDTLESFEKKGRSVEHRLYPQALDLAAAGRIRIQKREGGRWVTLEDER
jgi:phosphoribosylglycinamide formyltransferase-1